MAEICPPEKPEVGCRKTVQELVKDGDEIPDRYIWRESSDYGAVDPTVTLTAEIPVIDVSQLGLSSSAMDAELVKLRSALSSWGCFQARKVYAKTIVGVQAINHGIENSFLDEIRQLARDFFHLPMVEKQKHGRAGDDYEGYGNDLVLFENQPLDWTDRLYLLVSPEDRQKLNYWPENPESFRYVLREYIARLKQIQEQLLKSIAMSLSLPEDCFLNQFGERSTMYARFNYYPPCSRPDLVLGLKPHADGSGITILLQDKEVKGLQLLKDDKWFWVPIMPHALLVNIGDQLEKISFSKSRSSPRLIHGHSTNLVLLHFPRLIQSKIFSIGKSRVTMLGFAESGGGDKNGGVVAADEAVVKEETEDGDASGVGTRSIMSNGITKSPIHRAVTNSETERNTLAMFYSPDPEKEIEPLEELVDDERPRLFTKVRNYPDTYFHFYQRGKRPINAIFLANEECATCHHPKGGVVLECRGNHGPQSRVIPSCPWLKLSCPSAKADDLLAFRFQGA
ncbi:hypothetical protein DH2020_039344 [Rehmannia glutinosa]|uniref:Fe2OG dioxygenase domain-containing protein n=1 Tax=Rehmannia glutinosa TaxID=99300 RepID=A0ABR0UX81_REHGL